MTFGGPCRNCTIIQPAQTREECKVDILEKLASYISSSQMSSLTEETSFVSLGMDAVTQRRFWGEYWIATDIPLSMQPGGALENLLPDENFPKIPVTLGAFIDMLARERQGVSYLACDDCWMPG